LSASTTFRDDGVVVLRHVLATEWIERMRAAVDAEVESTSVVDLGAMAGTSTDSRAPRGQFRAGTDHWVATPEFLAFARDTPLPGLVADLLGSERVWLYEDSVLVKDPATPERTVFHQDLAYFHVDGDQMCTVWIPLDPVDADNGAVRYVRGSHRDRTTFRPNLFVTTDALPGTEGIDVPDHSDDPAVVHFDTLPGDVVVHHARTLHGAFANTTADRPRRALSIRYAGDDARFRIKPGAPQKAHHASLVEGRPLAAPACPQVWPSDAGAAGRR
jgi:ectoine hydroxylase-related dioxygenase (phytanoyl-CoA dioxygenase family)